MREGACLSVLLGPVLKLELPKINDIANPVYLFAQKQFIPNLTFDETREMVERLGYLMGLEFV